MTDGRVSELLRVVRDPRLGALVGAYACFKTAEMGSWIAVTVVAHRAGGIREASMVVAAELAPAAVLAIFVGALVQRMGTRAVLTFGLAAQALALGAIALLLAMSAPQLAVYGAAVVGAAAVVTARPAIAATLPHLVGEPRTLTAAYVVVGWLDGAGTLVGPAMTAALLLIGPAAPFVAFAALVTAAAALAASIPGAPGSMRKEEHVHLGAAIHEISETRGPGAALAVVGAQAFVTGCLDLIVVVMAVDVLGAASETAGWFVTAAGAGALCGGTASTLLIGRRSLWPVVVGAGVVTAAALAALVAANGSLAAGLVFAVIGGGAAVLLVASRTLLQRITELRLLCHVFAVAEALEMTMLLAGVVAVPAFVAVLGSRGAVLGVALVLILVLVGCTRALRDAEVDAGPAMERIAMLRLAAPFAQLPASALETVARAAEPMSFEPGATIMAQGDEGDAYHVITSGHVCVERDGVVINHLGAGSGVGELALLFGVPRTATVRTLDAVTTIAVRRDGFILAVTSYPPPNEWTDSSRGLLPAGPSPRNR